MRPALLDRLFAPATVLPGIGPQLGRLTERAAGPLVLDLLWHLPASVVDRRAAPPIRELNPIDWPDAVITLKLRVERHEPGFGRRPYRVHCTDGTGTLTLVYFSARGDQLQRLLPVGAERVERHEPGFGRRPYRVHCTDGTGTLTLVYFSARGDQLQRLLPVGAERVVSGTVDYY